jgi:hypothetical protein
LKNNYWSKLAFTSALGLLLSYTFVLLAALPIRYLRLTFGRKAFLMSTTTGFAMLTAFGFLQWALVYLSLCLLIGLYRELEEKKFSIFIASCFAIGTTLFANFFALLSYTQLKKINLIEFLSLRTQPFLDQLKQVPRFQGTNLNQVLWYIPSGMIITLMVVIFVSLTISRRSKSNFVELKMFRLPDWTIWVFILSLGATFIPMSEKVVGLIAMNLLAISMAAYFFQGFAVFTHFLDRYSIFGFWRLLAYFLIFFQLFVFISGLGILDYWFDFRLQNINTHRKLSKN